MNDKIFYPLAAIVAVALIAFSLVWPQGQGQVSPAPFGHVIELPDYFRAQHDKQIRAVKEAADRAARDQQTAERKAVKAASRVSESAESASAAAQAK